MCRFPYLVQLSEEHTICYKFSLLGDVSHDQKHTRNKSVGCQNSVPYGKSNAIFPKK
jgi:hypothetical protein